MGKLKQTTEEAALRSSLSKREKTTLVCQSQEEGKVTHTAETDQIQAPPTPEKETSSDQGSSVGWAPLLKKRERNQPTNPLWVRDD